MAPPLTGCALRLHHTTPLTAQRPGRGPGRGQRALVPLAAYSVTLQLPGGRTATFKTSGDRSVYEAAEAYGIKLPATCLQGSCTACAAKVVKGKVCTKGQSCIPPELSKEGYVTLCTARPQSDCVLQTHQGAAVRRMRREILSK